MRTNIILCAIVLSLTFVCQSFAQSGSRGGGGGFRGGGTSGGGGVRSSGGTRSGFGGSGTRVRQPSRAELARLAEQRKQEAQRLAELQDGFEREQFKETLVQLALRENRSANSRRQREALREAVQDFKSLRSEQLTPDQVGVLQVPFRLTDKEVDRSNGTVQWPEALLAEQFSELTESLNTTLADGVSDAESVEQFFGELKELNSALNQAAVDREIKSSNYAKARRFVTGLANEVRATDLGDVVLAKQ